MIDRKTKIVRTMVFTVLEFVVTVNQIQKYFHYLTIQEKNLTPKMNTS